MKYYKWLGWLCKSITELRDYGEHSKADILDIILDRACYCGTATVFLNRESWTGREKTAFETEIGARALEVLQR